MFKKGVNVDNHYFLVEIVRKVDDLRIVLYDPNVSESYSLEINYNEALEIMGGKEDFDLFVGMFRIKNEEIVLISGKENSVSEAN